jgi:hypothetical protein
VPALIQFLLGGEKPMKARYVVSIATLMLLFSFSLALAEDSDDSGELDATMRLMDDAEAESSHAVTRPIQLPEHLRVYSVATEKSEKGLKAANAGSGNSTFGRETADAARERASGMSEAAIENRENHGRSEDPPNRPDPPNPG